MTKIKYFSLISIIFSLLIAPNIAFGAASLSEDIQLELGTSIAADKPITAEIDVPSIIQLDEGFIISGENSYALEDQKLVYYWIIDGVRLSDHSSQILWRFSDPGEHVVELEISDGKKRSKTKEDIQVYQDTAIIFGKT
ncbi:MAG: hypothetical protein U9Q15_01185 [Patescibacteria group bacterium]|nr:hypothetical protein [Patescibacteria group bacterium]